ncbi:hypothetical protein BE04_31830 [Sorangium cellulosum]|uniref:Rhs family protein n=2 Tax=Sorangium cellulosum TaxID=56 RepID=A0A150Q2V9_SORCE|nr:hypothetical protein BE04_31830 [Sorangium cellulosum]
MLAADVDNEHGARTFVHAPGTFVPLLQQQDGRVLTYVNDHLGTPKELLDPRGLVAWSAAHSAWGKITDVWRDPISVLNHRTTVESPFRLLGQYADDETGLCYTRFRFFDPETGGWCSPDPLGIHGGRNLFGFDGSPSTVVDALGLATDEKPCQKAQTTVPTDLHAFGNKATPRPPRIEGHNTKPGQKADMVPDANKMLQPNVTQGASTFADPSQAPITGHYHTLPAGTKLPQGLGVVADGKDVGGTHARTHHTIVATEPMTPAEFESKYNSLPWSHGGKK